MLFSTIFQVVEIGTSRSAQCDSLIAQLTFVTLFCSVNDQRATRFLWNVTSAYKNSIDLPSFYVDIIPDLENANINLTWIVYFSYITCDLIHLNITYDEAGSLKYITTKWYCIKDSNCKCRTQSRLRLTKDNHTSFLLVIPRMSIKGENCSCYTGIILSQISGPRLNIKTVFLRYGDSHVKDKTAVRTSYL